MQLFKDTNFDFMGVRKICYFISIALILIGFISIAAHKGIKYNIDFTGGLMLQVELEGVKVEQLRTVLSDIGFKDAEIQQITNEDKEIFILKTVSTENAGDHIKEALRTTFPEATKGRFVIQEEEVGPKAGFELRNQAIKAVLIAIIFILIYIWIRFKFSWGISAAVALLHDTLLTIGMLSILNIEIGMTVLAALLTIVGYSINDTIVIFDRIRDDIKIYRKEDEYRIFNRSINSTLSRTAITSITTLVADLALLIWGGPVIRDFALTLLIGIIIGTYSSVFIASSLVLDTVVAYKNKSKKK
ncbi:MAG: protein translocase subunit SecF [Candidatus Cloacimonadales bacterium]|jgi:preprotein translocase subunit SecF|nr:protein translocase subunit SecF [Candidatus Cloacimonadota bacterium]MDD3500956.1 protein translocase subunit SecF [Candidatus Cloacimonadota bacterium]MDX9977491.1 protein translocase subunit SecF [Candidatus Cloacimonadales bacterium]